MAVQEREVLSPNPSPLEGADMETEVFYYRPWWFIRTMFLIAWCAFRHPFSTSTIDLATGRIIRQGEGE
jgi:hypothetical protein